jgi:hypothetical protein
MELTDWSIRPAVDDTKVRNIADLSSQNFLQTFLPLRISTNSTTYRGGGQCPIYRSLFFFIAIGDKHLN